MNKKQKPAWAGAFSQPHEVNAYKFTASIQVDKRLYKYDIAGSCAHAKMLSHIGILTSKESNSIIKCLRGIEKEIDSGKFKWKIELEDIHMNVESALIDRIGETGEKLHTARSRNDQIALDMRLWMRDQIAVTTRSIQRLQQTLVDVAEKNINISIPGYTHLQRAQPVLVGHHLLAYVEMLSRDYIRFDNILSSIKYCPLGSGALAGTTIKLDREMVALELGFVDSQKKPLLTSNSMDAVSDRDFIIEFLLACSLTAMHLSQICEELIIWCTSEFSFISISDAYCTGSSLMPNKKNPDIPEIIRGKTGRIYGNLINLLVTIKGLPLTYNYDLQEDKEALFDSADTTLNCVNILSDLFNHISFNKESCAKAVADPSLLATDLVDWLVVRQVPFRSAHHAVGELVALCIRNNKKLNELTEKELKSVHPALNSSALEVFELGRSLNARTIPGAPSFKNVKNEIKTWRRKLILE